MKHPDYIIVGAGSAGCILANRLSRDPGTRVLLIEAGKDTNNILMKMPAGFAYASKNPRFDWGYTSEPEPGLGGRRMPCPRGKVVGGSSAVNAMAFIRGSRQDFDAWARVAGPSWSFDSCLPYFKSIETFSGGANAYRGGSGPLGVKAPGYSNPLYHPFLDAAKEAGYRLNPDVNGAEQEGFGPMDQCIEGGRRSSAATAFIDPVRDRPNLRIMPEACVKKVVLDRGRATGVDVVVEGTVERIVCEREVILAAGAVGSPHILMLSGVGDASRLRRLDIDVVADSPEVGANLMDHVDVTVRQTCPVPITESLAMRLDQRLLIGLEWILFKTGRGSTNHFEVNGYIRTPSAAGHPNIQLCFMPLLVAYDGAPALRNAHGYQVSVMLMPIQSRGRIELDDSAQPRLTFNYLQYPSEVAQLAEGVEAVRDILDQPSMRKYRGSEIAPGEGVTSSADLETFIRRTAKSTHHVCGTCRMGSDSASVVDEVGRVRQVEGLRVVDASIMPLITSGNINAPTMMLAEKIASTLI